MPKPKLISQLEVIDLLRAEGLTSGVSHQGTVCAFVEVPMYSQVAFRVGAGGPAAVSWYDQAEVLRFISDYREAKAGRADFRNK